MVDICNKLEEQYSSSFSHPDPKFKIENPKEFFTIDEKDACPKLCDIDFTQKSIIDAIGDVKNNTAPGIDPLLAVFF